MIKHPNNKLERALIEEAKENNRKGKSPIRKVREEIKDQETADELRALYRGRDLETEYRGSSGSLLANY